MTLSHLKLTLDTTGKVKLMMWVNNNMKVLVKL